MKLCKLCGKDIEQIVDNDLLYELTSQADYYGMESLTENQQLLVTGIICGDCYNEI